MVQRFNVEGALSRNAFWVWGGNQRSRCHAWWNGKAACTALALAGGWRGWRGWWRHSSVQVLSGPGSGSGLAGHDADVNVERLVSLVRSDLVQRSMANSMLNDQWSAATLLASCSTVLVDLELQPAVKSSISRTIHSHTRASQVWPSGCGAHTGTYNSTESSTHCRLLSLCLSPLSTVAQEGDLKWAVDLRCIGSLVESVQSCACRPAGVYDRGGRGAWCWGRESSVPCKSSAMISAACPQVLCIYLGWRCEDGISGI